MITLENFPFHKVMKALRCEGCCSWFSSASAPGDLFLSLPAISSFELKVLLSMLPGVYFLVRSSIRSSYGVEIHFIFE